jgi:hypothetical protein
MSKSRPQLGRRIDRPAPETETPPVKSPETETSGERQGVSPPSDHAAESPVEETEPTVEPAKAGRPPGAKNREYVRGERFPGMCPKCKCTDATSESRRVIELSNDPDFTHVALIRCKCKKCKQWRIDRQKCNPAE